MLDGAEPDAIAMTGVYTVRRRGLIPKTLVAFSWQGPCASSYSCSLPVPLVLLNPCARRKSLVPSEIPSFNSA
jgi:hypothetical protein